MRSHFRVPRDAFKWLFGKFCWCRLTSIMASTHNIYPYVYCIKMVSCLNIFMISHFSAPRNALKWLLAPLKGFFIVFHAREGFFNSISSFFHNNPFNLKFIGSIVTFLIATWMGWIVSCYWIRIYSFCTTLKWLFEKRFVFLSWNQKWVASRLYQLNKNK